VSIASYNPASPGGSQPARASYGGHVSIRRHANSHLWGSPSTAAAVRKPLRRRTLKTWPLTSTNVPGYQRRLAIPDVAVVHVVRRAVHTRPTMIRAGSNRSVYSRYLQKSRFCDIGLLASSRGKDNTSASDQTWAQWQSQRSLQRAVKFPTRQGLSVARASIPGRGRGTSEEVREYFNRCVGNTDIERCPQIAILRQSD
jgi:hypothetical protein